MAFVPEFACGFEIRTIPVEAGRFVFDGGNLSYTTPHTGTGGLRFYIGRFSVIREASSSNVDLSVWVNPETKSPRIGLYMADAGEVELRYNNTEYTWDLYVDDVLVEAGEVATTESAWQHVQIRVQIAASGTFFTRIDGVPDLEYSGNLIPDASDQVSRIYLRHVAGYSSWDDLVFGAGGWPNDLRIDPLYLDADSGTPEWTPSTGSDNYACVDDVPPSADYVFTNVDARDLYTLADWDDTDGLGNVIKDPIAVTTWVQVRKEDGTRDDKVRFLQSDGANEAQTAYTSLLTSYQNLHHLRTVQPGGGVWDKAGIDGLLVGIEADMV